MEKTLKDQIKTMRVFKVKDPQDYPFPNISLGLTAKRGNKSLFVSQRKWDGQSVTTSTDGLASKLSESPAVRETFARGLSQRQAMSDSSKSTRSMVIVFLISTIFGIILMWLISSGLDKALAPGTQANPVTTPSELMLNYYQKDLR